MMVAYGPPEIIDRNSLSLKIHLVSYYADGASLLRANAPIATGEQAIRTIWASLLTPGNSLSWEAIKIEVAAATYRAIGIDISPHQV
jgi:ketosteroid isomerase-like protein